jgi:hypothetical protein
MPPCLKIILQTAGFCFWLVEKVGQLHLGKLFYLQTQIVIPVGHTSTCAGASVGTMCEAGFWPKQSVGKVCRLLRFARNDRERLKSLEKFA